MSLERIVAYLNQYAHTMKPITNLSYDSENKNCDWCRCDNTVTFCFDDIISEYCDSRQIDHFNSVDAISVHNGVLNLIEFKNSSCRNQSAKKNIKGSISDSIRFLEKIVLQSNFLDSYPIKARFILVFNPFSDIREDTGIDKIHSEMNRLAKKASPHKERLQTLNSYIQGLQLCDECIFLYPQEFIDRIDEFIC